MRIAGTSQRRVRILGQRDDTETVRRIGRAEHSASPSDWKHTAATRFLCASAHLNRLFRAAVIRQFEEKYKAIAPSSGIDPGIVLKHCFAARRQNNIRDLLLFCVCLVAVLLFYVSVRTSVSPDVPESMLLGLFILFVLAWIIVVVDKWKTQSLVRTNLLKDNFDPDCVATPASASFERIESELELAQKGNVLVYSAFSPFAGAGYEISGWSFALDVEKGKEQFGHIERPQSFTVPELYDEITRTLRGLDIPDFVLEDKVCMHGQDIRGEQQILPDPLQRPLTTLGQEALRTLISNPSPQMRHYKHIRMVSWGGELVLSTFLRFSKSSHNLFVEVNYCLLPPLAEQHHHVDSLNPFLDWRDWLSLVITSGVSAAFRLLFMPLTVLNKALQPLTKWQKRSAAKQAVRVNSAYNHGAAYSLREWVSVNTYRRYFQKLDKEMHLKILERQILDTIVRFLDARNIDTSDLKERQTTILNNGLVVSGSGTIQAESMAVGTHAQAFVDKFKESGLKWLNRGLKKPVGEQ